AGPGGQPRFLPSQAQKQAQGRVGVSKSSAYRGLSITEQINPKSKIQNPKSFVPGDENWDSRFYLPGVNSEVHAIAITGTNIYVGGVFATAGRASVNSIA